MVTITVTNESPTDVVYAALEALDPLVLAVASLPQPATQGRFCIERTPEWVRMGIRGRDDVQAEHARIGVFSELVEDGIVDEHAPLHVFMAAASRAQLAKIANARAPQWLVSATVREGVVSWTAPLRNSSSYPPDWVGGLIRELGECLATAQTR